MTEKTHAARIYNGWLVSNSFWLRTFAVTGYGIVGAVIIWVFVFLMGFLLSFF